MASGRPTIVSSGAGASELIEDGVNGFLFAAGDPDGLAEVLEHVLGESPARLAEIGRAGQETVRTALDPKTIAAGGSPSIVLRSTTSRAALRPHRRLARRHLPTPEDTGDRRDGVSGAPAAPRARWTCCRPDLTTDLASMTMRPTLACLIPAYNAAAHLPRLLEFAARQTEPFDEIWVYDDCSTDDTAAVAEHYGRPCGAGRGESWLHVRKECACRTDGM